MKFSIVATLYNSEAYLDEFCERCATAAKTLVGDDYEIILVNDGSPDRSLSRAVELHEASSHIKILDLSMNFGHHKAMMAGLQYSSGDFIYLIDADLEEQPEWMVDFYEELQSKIGLDSIDVVYGVQNGRKGGWFERASGDLFFKAFKYFSNIELIPNLSTVRLMRRRYVNALVQHNESEFFIAGLWAITGFNQKGMEVNKASKGTSSYTFVRKVSLAVNAIISFSVVPLKVICIFGLITSLVAALFAIFVIFRHITGEMATGWPSIVVSIVFFGGLNLFALGIIGLYVGKIFSEVKQRPNTIFRQVYDKSKC